jgi:DNA-binding LacI/PurR family transcriptional regulator
LKFLAERLVVVPARLSLVAFDNTTEAAAINLTSYDFDQAGRLHQAFSFALGRPGTGAKTPQTIEWPGILYQRKSSGPAPVNAALASAS